MERREWAGGRVRAMLKGDVYLIEKMVAGRRYSLNLGVIGEDRARAEYALFLQSPHTYRAPAERVAEEQNKKAEAENRALAGAVVITTELITAYRDAALEGVHRRAASAQHVRECCGFIGEFAKAPQLAGRDLRSVTLGELNAALDQWSKSRRKRIVALKSFTKFLRRRGLLSAKNDPTVDLTTPQPRTPTEAEKEDKVYSPEDLEAFYRHLDKQESRDVFLVRTYTGLHLTEIRRIAEGKGSLRRVGKGEIVGTVSVEHKSGQTHVQSLNAKAFAAFERLVSAGRIPSEGRLIEAGRRACISLGYVTKDGKADDDRRVQMANLRHTFITHATESGKLVNAEGDGGVPVNVVAQLVGHHDTKTTSKFYIAKRVPPMVVIPVMLEHPDDPSPTLEILSPSSGSALSVHAKRLRSPSKDTTHEPAEKPNRRKPLATGTTVASRGAERASSTAGTRKGTR
jgi:integrase